MFLNCLRTPILLLLSLLTSGSLALFPLVSFGNDTRSLLVCEQDADSDEVDETSESKLVATLEPRIQLCNHTCFHGVSDEVNHQIDWLFVHEHAARAPPLTPGFSL